MKTGRYRVRRTWNGKCVLQQLNDIPSFSGGHVDVSIRNYLWEDVQYDDLENIAFQMRPLNSPTP